MLCGYGHDEDELPKVVGLIHLLEDDPGLHEVLDLPDGWEATRESPEQSWVRMKSDPEDVL